MQPELFVVGEMHGEVVATAMAGYEGHRGWVNYLAVSERCRRRGFGRRLMAHIEAQLTAMGCPKLNMQVRTGNAAALAFYERLGYVPDKAVALGKRLIPDP